MKLDQYTVRIYDTTLVNKVDEIFKKCKDIYPTKNPFLVDCILRGVETIEKDLLGEKQIESIADLFYEIHLTIEKLEKLTKLCEKNAKEIIANLTVNQNSCLVITIFCLESLKIVQRKKILLRQECLMTYLQGLLNFWKGCLKFILNNGQCS